jgi:hypothetical protein
MADFGDLILSVTARLTHDLDFAFTKNNGDLANRLRSKFAHQEEESTNEAQVLNLDEDGDIRIRFKGATCYISAGSIAVAGWLTSAKMLEEQGVDELSETIEHIFEERPQFQRREYDLRLLIYTGSVLPEDFDTALSRSCGVALQSMFADATPRLTRGRLLVEYQKGKFQDSLDFEASKAEEVQLRYGRTGKAQDFGSYAEFLRAADLRGLVEHLRPFAETFRRRLPLRHAGS